MMVADWPAPLMQGEEHAERAAAVDEGRCPPVEIARAREDKANCDRAQTEADPGSDVRQGNRTRRVSGHFSDKE